MKVLDGQDTYRRFMERLRSVPSRVLLLDYDGTLAPFHFDRTQAFPYSEVPELLTELIAQNTRVVLITGRPAPELVRLSGIDPHPEIWGSHGLERLLPDGRYELEKPSPQDAQALARSAELLRRDGLASRLEAKPGGVAIHWRGLAAGERSILRKRVLELWSPFLAVGRLSLLNFDGGLELRAPGKNKGDAVRTILAETEAGAAVAYLGDDQTDEDAFQAVKGKGLAVLVRATARLTTADVWLRPPKELLEFLKAWLRASGGEA